MEQVLDIEIPVEKIYNDRKIAIGTFLGGPLAAGYFIAENFKVFNENEKAKKTWIYTIIVTIIIFGGLFLIPENIRIPNQIIPLIYIAIAYFLIQHFQGENIKSHINSGGQLFSWWRTIAVGIIGLAITIIPIIGFVLLSDTVANDSISTNTYGMMKHEISFDKNNLTEGEVNQLADGFIRTTFFDESVTKYVYAEKINNKYEISLSVVDGIANDSQELQPFNDLRLDLQTFFPKNKIIFKLVVDNLDNVVKRLE